MVQLPVRRQTPLDEAQAALDRAYERLESLRHLGAVRTEVRTAECDWFGAEEALALSRAAADGRLDPAVASVMPAEVMLVRIGPWRWWAGRVRPLSSFR